MILFGLGILILVAIIAATFKHGGKLQPKHNSLYMERMRDAKKLAEERGDVEALQAIKEDRYDELLQNRELARRASRMPDIYIEDYNIAGINFRKGIKDYVGKFEGYLMPEPDNKHDRNAIAIHHRDGKHLGYIPAGCTDHIRGLNYRFPIAIYGDIEEDYDYDERRKYYRGTIYLTVKRQ